MYTSFLRVIYIVNYLEANIDIRVSKFIGSYLLFHIWPSSKQYGLDKSRIASVIPVSYFLRVVITICHREIQVNTDTET